MVMFLSLSRSASSSSIARRELGADQEHGLCHHAEREARALYVLLAQSEQWPALCGTGQRGGCLLVVGADRARIGSCPPFRAHTIAHEIRAVVCEPARKRC